MFRISLQGKPIFGVNLLKKKGMYTLNISSVKLKTMRDYAKKNGQAQQICGTYKTSL